MPDRDLAGSIDSPPATFAPTMVGTYDVRRDWALQERRFLRSQLMVTGTSFVSQVTNGDEIDVELKSHTTVTKRVLLRA